MGLEQLGLPSPKHKYRDRGRSTLVLLSNKNTSPEIGLEELPINEIHQKKDEESSYEELESQFESAKGSNSFTEDGDSAMSVHEEASCRPKYNKFGDGPSTSTAYPEYAVSQEKEYYSDDVTVSCRVGDAGNSIVGTGEGSSQYIDDGFQLCETLEEHLLEFGCHLDCGDGCSKQCADKEIEQLFGVRQDNYVLSSGGWNTNEGMYFRSCVFICIG